MNISGMHSSAEKLHIRELHDVAASQMYGVVNPTQIIRLGECRTWAIRGFENGDGSVTEQISNTDYFGEQVEPFDLYRITDEEIKRFGRFTVDVTVGHLEAKMLPRNFFEERAFRVRYALGKPNPNFLKR